MMRRRSFDLLEELLASQIQLRREFDGTTLTMDGEELADAEEEAMGLLRGVELPELRRAAEELRDLRDASL